MTRTARLLLVVSAPTIALAISAISSTAHGHARMKSPTPRDTHSDYKSPPENNVGIGEPCGVARTASQPSTTLTPGAALTVTWEETINHKGCFLVDFSPASDGNWQMLGVKSHSNPPAPATPSTTTPRQWSVGVTLPSTPCTACTMRVRQLMLNSDQTDSACPTATVPAGGTYYSCANVVLGTTGAGGSGGGTGGATGTAGRGGNAGGGRGGNGGSSAAGQAGTSGQAGSSGQAGTSGQAAARQAGTSGQAGDNGQAGTSGQAGSGATGQAGDSGQAGDNGQAGTSGQAGNGASGTAGSSATGQAGTNGGGEASGGCRIGDGATPAPLALLIGILLLRRSRRRSRS